MCKVAVVTYFEKRMTRESVKTADISRYLPNTIRKIIWNTSRERYCYASLTGRLIGLLTDMVCVHLTANPLVGLPTLLWPMNFFFSWFDSPSGPRPPHRWGFEITYRRTILSRTPLDEWSASCWDLYLTTRNIHKRQTATTPARFEPAIPASELQQTHALDRAELGSAVNWFRHSFFMRC